MKEKNTGEFAGGVEVGPVDSGSAFASVEHERLKRRVQRCQESEIGRVVGVFVFGVDPGSLFLSSPLLARHFLSLKTSNYRLSTHKFIEYNLSQYNQRYQVEQSYEADYLKPIKLSEN